MFAPFDNCRLEPEEKRLHLDISIVSAGFPDEFHCLHAFARHFQSPRSLGSFEVQAIPSPSPDQIALRVSSYLGYEVWLHLFVFQEALHSISPEADGWLFFFKGRRTRFQEHVQTFLGPIQQCLRSSYRRDPATLPWAFYFDDEGGPSFTGALFQDFFQLPFHPTIVQDSTPPDSVPQQPEQKLEVLLEVLLNSFLPSPFLNAPQHTGSTQEIYTQIVSAVRHQTLSREERMAQLRQVLSFRSEQPGWSALCECLTCWPEEQGLSLAIEYAREHLRSWSSGRLPLPPLWTRLLLEDRVFPAMFLARKLFLTLSTKHSYPLEKTWFHHPLLEQFEWITINNAHFTDKRLSQFLSSAACKDLKALELAGTSLTKKGFKLLSKSEHLAHLKILNLSNHPISPSTLKTIVHSPHLGAVRTLWLTHCRLNAQALASWNEKSTLHQLRELNLSYNDISEEGLYSLTGLPQLAGLRVLNLRGNLFPGGGKALAICPALSQLEELDISHCGLEDQDIEDLLRSPHIKGLRRLSIDNPALTEKTLSMLMAHPHFTQLKYLKLNPDGLCEGGLDLLRSAPLLKDVLIE